MFVIMFDKLYGYFIFSLMILSAVGKGSLYVHMKFGVKTLYLLKERW